MPVTSGIATGSSTAGCVRGTRWGGAGWSPAKRELRTKVGDDVQTHAHQRRQMTGERFVWPTWACVCVCVWICARVSAQSIIFHTLSATPIGTQIQFVTPDFMLLRAARKMWLLWRRIYSSCVIWGGTGRWGKWWCRFACCTEYGEKCNREWLHSEMWCSWVSEPAWYAAYRPVLSEGQIRVKRWSAKHK